MHIAHCTLHTNNKLRYTRDLEFLVDFFGSIAFSGQQNEKYIHVANECEVHCNESMV